MGRRSSNYPAELRERAVRMVVPVHPAARAVPSAPAVNGATPRAVFALPPRSRVPAMTGGLRPGRCIGGSARLHLPECVPSGPGPPARHLSSG